MVPPRIKPLTEPAELLRRSNRDAFGEDPRQELHRQLLGVGPGPRLVASCFCADNLAAQVDQDLGDVDLDRADLVQAPQSDEA